MPKSHENQTEGNEAHNMLFERLFCCLKPFEWWRLMEWRKMPFEHIYDNGHLCAHDRWTKNERNLQCGICSKIGVIATKLQNIIF